MSDVPGNSQKAEQMEINNLPGVVDDVNELAPSNDNSAPLFLQFSCLYSRHKTQKRKVWQDGRLVVRNYGAELYSACPTAGSADSALDRCELSCQEINSFIHRYQLGLEMDKFLVTVEGPWIGDKIPKTVQSEILPKRLSSSMQKVVTTKFRKPPSAIPPNPARQQDQLVLGKRRRPLQPGELLRKHYPHLSTGPGMNRSVLLGSTSDTINPMYQQHNMDIQRDVQNGGNGKDVHQSLDMNENYQQSYSRYMQSDSTKCYSEVSDDSAGTHCHGQNIGLPSAPSLSSVRDQHERENAPSLSSVRDQHERENAGIVEFPSSNAKNSQSRISCDQQPNSKTQLAIFPSKSGNELTKGNQLSGNSFNPVSYYGEESDENDEEQLDEPFQLLCSQQDRSAHVTKTVFSSEAPCEKASPSNGISTLSTDQLLAMLARPVCQPGNANCSKDEYALPEADASSEDD